MALIASLGALLAACFFALVGTAVGLQTLRWLKISIRSVFERLLLAAAVGVIVLEVALFAAQASGKIPAGVLVTFLLACGFVPVASRELKESFGAISARIIRAPKIERVLAALTGLVAFWEGIAAVAPLTGSDALHYHFAAPLQTLRYGFHPDFFLMHGFLTGQGHLLILAGLAAGSEKVALSLLWLGGVLAAAAAACLARKWVSPSWAWIVALAFLLNPVVFWQSTAAGAPDLWMAFFATAAVLAIIELSPIPDAKLALLCGALAGGIAGAKYTGCLIAAALLIAFVWETRAWSRVAPFLGAALATGVWPYLRNLIWTGDPVFPFALRWLAPEKVNSLALDALRADTGSSGHRDALQLAQFPFFAAVQHAHGFWEFFGPLVLLLAPIFVLCIKRSSAWRVVLVTCLVGSLAVGATSGMLRFILPLLPIALAAAFAGAAELRARGWRRAWLLSCASIAGFLLFGLAGMIVYTRPAIAASAGLLSRERYLELRAPDYTLSQAVNQVLGSDANRGGRVLVFMRHVYYLRVPFAYSDPLASWEVDPARLRTAEEWKPFLRQHQIDWVVRAPEYPPEIAASLTQLEVEGALVPFAQKDIVALQGLRLLGVRTTVTATILRVKN